MKKLNRTTWDELLIAEAIAKISKDKTVVTIAHKLSTIINSNRIIFIKNGKIAEAGSHQELMARDGFYKKMYEAEILGLRII